MQLAVIDHNAHVSRGKLRNQKGDEMYQEKYCKASKKWDVTPVKEKKEYSYVPEITTHDGITQQFAWPKNPCCHMIHWR